VACLIDLTCCSSDMKDLWILSKPCASADDTVVVVGRRPGKVSGEDRKPIKQLFDSKLMQLNHDIADSDSHTNLASSNIRPNVTIDDL
jgi:hypothetical protein